MADNVDLLIVTPEMLKSSHSNAVLNMIKDKLTNVILDEAHL